MTSRGNHCQEIKNEINEDGSNSEKLPQNIIAALPFIVPICLING